MSLRQATNTFTSIMIEAQKYVDVKCKEVKSYLQNPERKSINEAFLQTSKFPEPCEA